MNLPSVLEMNARKFKNSKAIITTSESITYEELNNRVNIAAHGLLALDITKGDKVLMVVENGFSFLEVYFALQKIGAIAVPVNVKMTAEEIAYITNHCAAKFLIVSDLHFDKVREIQYMFASTVVIGESISGTRSWNEIKDMRKFENMALDFNDDELCTILYTSGTTGFPKGVEFTHRNVMAAAMMMIVELQMNADSKILHIMPFSHPSSLYLFLCSGLLVGATHIIPPKFSPEILVSLVEEHHVTHCFSAPIIFLMTSGFPNISKYDLSSVTWVYGGAPLSMHQSLYIRNKFQSTKFYCIFGLTETGVSGGILLPEEHKKKAGSIGKRAMFGTEIKIVNERGQTVSTGDVGEILIKGEAVTKQYYHDKQRTHLSIKDGWFKTGDLAMYDKDGFIWLVDQKKDVIMTEQTQVYPKEIEDILIMHENIIEASVVGIPHPTLGEVVKAYVVVKENFSNIENDLGNYLEYKIANHKIPRVYEAVAELPRNASGKILKHVLREWYKESMSKG